MMNNTRNINSHLVVECGAYGIPVPDYQWIFNGSVVTQHRSLNLSSLRLVDQGLYTCIANNSLGSANGRFYLTIQGKTKYAQSCNYVFFTNNALCYERLHHFDHITQKKKKKILHFLLYNIN